MTEFEEWYGQHIFLPESGGSIRDRLTSAFLAGQASAIAPVGFQRSDVIALQECVEELTRERDELERLFGVAFKQCEALKAQAVEPCGNCFEGKSDMDHVCPKCNGTGFTHPTNEPVKAQAGEPVAWMKTNGGNGNEKVFISAHMKQRGYDDFDVPLFTHPTTERRVIPEDVRKVMGMALDALDLYFGDFHPDNLDKFEVTGYEAIAALRNALNAAPIPKKDDPVRHALIDEASEFMVIAKTKDLQAFAENVKKYLEESK